MSVSAELDTIQSAMEVINSRRWLTTTGLDPARVPTWLTPDDHILLATYLATMGDMEAWARGDQIVIVQNEARVKTLRERWDMEQKNKYLRARYDEMVDLYRNVELKTLLNNASTARTWPHATRQQSQVLGYSHHEALNSRSAEEREYYLDMAEAHGWTVAQLRAELYGRRTIISPTNAPVPPSTITDLFRLMDLPVSIEPNRAVFATARGRVIVESSSELIWRIEQ